MKKEFDVIESSVLEILEKNYCEYGQYVNRTRGNVTIDGLKAVQRRVLLSVRDKDNGGEIGSSEVISHCLNNYHPHGLDSTYDTLVRLVQKGFVVPAANFGNIDTFDPSDAAAYRYTYVKSHKPFSDGIFKFVDLVEKYENEYGKIEPKYLPTPIPLALTTGSEGIGFGTSSRIPMFSAKSLFEALHSDDPRKLRAPSGLFVVGGDVEHLWKTGDGWLQYGYKCFKEHSELDGKDVSIIEGPGRYFSTNIDHVFKSFEEDGSVVIRDESKNRTRVAISRVKNIKRVTDEEVHNLAIQASIKQIFFKVCYSDEGVTKKISIQEWMQSLWKLYDEVVTKYKLDRIDKINDKIKITNLIPKMAPLIKKEMSSEDIATTLKVDLSVVHQLEARPMKMLRRFEFEKEIDDLNKEAITVSKLNSKTLAQDVVNVLEKAQTT